MSAAVAIKREPPVIAGRVPPHDLSAEAAVLSAVLIEKALDTVSGIVTAADFYSEGNGRIFQAAVDMAADGRPIDIQTMASWLRDREYLQEVGGASYIMQLAYEVPMMANVAAYAETVRDKARVRRAIAACQRIAAEGYGDVGPVNDFLEAAERTLGDVAMHGRRSVAQYLGAALQTIWSNVVAGGAKPTGIPTGFVDVDRKLGGLQRKRTYVIGARPGVGKSSWARALAMNVSSIDTGTDPRHGVLIFALEMTREEIALGVLCSQAGVDPKRLAQALCGDAEWAALTDVVPSMANLPILIDDTSSLSLTDIRARTKMAQVDLAKAKTRLAVVIIDQMQLVKTAGKKGASRQQELGEISRGLKQLAKDMDVAVIELAALNRDSEKEKRRPQLSDLRESGDFESDGDVVAFLHRDMRTPEEKESDKGKRGDVPEDGVCEFIIRKARVGETGLVSLKFTARCTRFDNFAGEGSYR